MFTNEFLGFVRMSQHFWQSCRLWTCTSIRETYSFPGFAPQVTESLGEESYSQSVKTASLQVGRCWLRYLLPRCSARPLFKVRVRRGIAPPAQKGTRFRRVLCRSAAQRSVARSLSKSDSSRRRQARTDCDRIGWSRGDKASYDGRWRRHQFGITLRGAILSCQIEPETGAI